jgi:hypothetical protein
LHSTLAPMLSPVAGRGRTTAMLAERLSEQIAAAT